METTQIPTIQVLPKGPVAEAWSRLLDTRIGRKVLAPLDPVIAVQPVCETAGQGCWIGPEYTGRQSDGVRHLAFEAGRRAHGLEARPVVEGSHFFIQHRISLIELPLEAAPQAAPQARNQRIIS
jgi:hypothetical protein